MRTGSFSRQIFFFDFFLMSVRPGRLPQEFCTHATPLRALMPDSCNPRRKFSKCYAKSWMRGGGSRGYKLISGGCRAYQNGKIYDREHFPMPVLTLAVCTRATPPLNAIGSKCTRKHFGTIPGRSRGLRPRRCGAPGCDCVGLPVRRNCLVHVLKTS